SIRDKLVTGVQTCALPISFRSGNQQIAFSIFRSESLDEHQLRLLFGVLHLEKRRIANDDRIHRFWDPDRGYKMGRELNRHYLVKSEERRVGKESRSQRWRW